MKINFNPYKKKNITILSGDVIMIGSGDVIMIGEKVIFILKSLSIHIIAFEFNHIFQNHGICIDASLKVYETKLSFKNVTGDKCKFKFGKCLFFFF